MESEEHVADAAAAGDTPEPQPQPSGNGPEKQTTNYVVLCSGHEHDEPDEAAAAWYVVETGIPAGGAKAALRKVLGSGEGKKLAKAVEGGGSYTLVAVPERSWQPQPLKYEKPEPQVKLG